MDGLTLTAALHRRGLNVRYLGTLLMELERVEEKGRLSHIQVVTDETCFYIFRGVSLETGSFSQRISLSEIILRSAKHIFRTFLQVKCANGAKINEDEWFCMAFLMCFSNRVWILQPSPLLSVIS